MCTDDEEKRGREEVWRKNRRPKIIKLKLKVKRYLCERWEQGFREKIQRKTSLF
jgi:hypothetical protein